MEIGDFINSIADFYEVSAAQQVDYIVFHLMEHGGRNSLTARMIEEAFEKSHLPKYGRTAQYLVDAVKKKRYVKLATGYALCRPERDAIRKKVGEPAAAKVNPTLRTLIPSLKSPNSQDYLEEAIRSFEAICYRAAIVMTWCLVYSEFKSWLFSNHLSALNAQMATWKNPKAIGRIEDFQDFVESQIIDTARAAKIIGKELHKNLIALLDKRNSLGHPTGKHVSDTVAQAFIEECVHDVLQKL